MCCCFHLTIGWSVRCHRWQIIDPSALNMLTASLPLNYASICKCTYMCAYSHHIKAGENIGSISIYAYTYVSSDLITTTCDANKWWICFLAWSIVGLFNVVGIPPDLNSSKWRSTCNIWILHIEYRLGCLLRHISYMFIMWASVASAIGTGLLKDFECEMCIFT